jgi:site-specific DNA recombinase
MSTVENFSRFAKTNLVKGSAKDNRNVVIYTRVSTKEQADKNLSLDTQLKIIKEYCERNNLNIIECFGGTYESAKTDGRKEFNRMLEFVKKSKYKVNGKISQIIVYTIDRFSRTGGAAIKLVNDLRKQCQVEINAVTQPIDTSNPGGKMQQGLYLLVSEMDNEMRSMRVIEGMTAKFEKGIWVVKCPFGYDSVKVNGIRKIVINDDGKKLKKAFEWKLQGLKNEEILAKLQAMGLKIYPQKLCKVLVNPFYCGMLVHKMLKGKVVEGTHEKLITPEQFLRINNLLKEKSRYGVPHEKENELMPLKVFMKCAVCGESMTGYTVKKKGGIERKTVFHYYKCRSNGCNCNKSVKEIHKLFMDHLSKLTITPELIEPLLFQMVKAFTDRNKEIEEQEKAFKAKIEEVSRDMERIERKYYVKEEMSRETFEKFYAELVTKKNEVLNESQKLPSVSSNTQKYFKSGLELALNLPKIWDSSPVKVKERLQKQIFPAGLLFDKQKQSFLTPEINPAFFWIDELARDIDPKRKGQPALADWLSLSAERGGFEPPVRLPVRQFSKLLV